MGCRGARTTGPNWRRCDCDSERSTKQAALRRGERDRQVWPGPLPGVAAHWRGFHWSRIRSRAGAGRPTGTSLSSEGRGRSPSGNTSRPDPARRTPIECWEPMASRELSSLGRPQRSARRRRGAEGRGRALRPRWCGRPNLRVSSPELAALVDVLDEDVVGRDAFALRALVGSSEWSWEAVRERCASEPRALG
jgi:hypothetical protein